MRWFMCAVILAVLVLGIIIVPGAADADRPAIIVAISAVVVAALGILVQSESARQQTRVTTTLQHLTLTPLITGGLKDGRLQFRNAGKGPARDLRATAFRRPDRKRNDPGCEAREVGLTESYLGPNEIAYTRREGQAGEYRDVKTNVLIIHCTDLMDTHYHGWRNWTREDAYEEGGPWIFETVERSPEAIRRNCVVCSKRDTAQPESPSES